MKKSNNKIKVLVALSGGVDSAVAAALLVKQGYNVTGAYFVNYDDERKKEKGERNPTSCWLPDYRDAVRVAAKLQISIKKLNFIKEYKEKVLNYMFKEYKAGRTPNPDVLCNKYIKFGVWLDWALKNKFDYLATGHYARVGRKKEKGERKKRNKQNLLLTHYSLLLSKDTDKDQTYFLHQLNQKQLSHVMFPVGNLLKSEVRSLAHKYGLPVAQKAESMGICFIGEVPMKEFLQTQIKPKPGKIVLGDGTVIGKHDGLAFYTIGQRHFREERRTGNGERGVLSSSLRGATKERRRNPLVFQNKPLYVVAKNSKTNELIVGYENDQLLYSKQIKVSNVNWIVGQNPKFPLKCMVRLRHRQPLQPATVDFSESDFRLQSWSKRVRSPKSEVRLIFATPQRAVTPGQFAVFYLKDECLGGGIIQ